MTNYSFLQSRAWSDFQNSCGRKTFNIENKLAIEYPLPLGLCYLYSPRPYFDDAKTLKNFLHEAQKIAKHENAIFVRLEPDLNSTLLPNIYNLKPVHNIQPQDTIILDLSHTEETLLENMHPKTRYNINLAKRHGITIKKSTDPKNIDIFYNLALKTGERDNFTYHERSYYEKMLEVFGKNKMVELFIAYYDDTPTAAIIVLFYKDTAVYLHGASDHKFRNLMSPYLLQWEAIKEAKKRGIKLYDLWGVAPANSENHSWSGITRFKKGFASDAPIIHYPDCFEISTRPTFYSIYKLYKSIR
jgi:lipid II:glycine glycyltransferase (peptidoglycan interpeptide bridge formation enzyme)